MRPNISLSYPEEESEIWEKACEEILKIGLKKNLYDKAKVTPIAMSQYSANLESFVSTHLFKLAPSSLLSAASLR